MKESRNTVHQQARRIFALMLAALMVVSVLPVGSFAQDGADLTPGTEPVTEATEATEEATEATEETTEATEEATEATEEATEPDSEVLQAQLNGMLDALKLYLEKESFTKEERQTLTDELALVGKFCYDNGITALTPEQQTLYDLLAQAILMTPEVAYAAQVTTPGIEGSVVYPTLAEAIQAANDGDTVTLLKTVVGEGIVIEKSITLDLGGFTYHVTEEYAAEYACLVLPSAGSVTIKNGSFASPITLALLANGANLTLMGVKLNATGSNDTGTPSFALFCTAGSTTLTGGTALSASGSNVALYMISNGARVRLTVAPGSGQAAINGTVVLEPGRGAQASLDAQQTDADLVLELNEASVSGALLISPDGGSLTVTKGASTNLAAPEGYQWENGTDLKRITQVAQIGEITYSSLEEALQAAVSGDTVKLLASVSGTNLYIDKYITLDLNGHTYSVSALSGSAAIRVAGPVPTALALEQYQVVIKNGTLAYDSFVVQEQMVLLENSSSLVLQNVNLITPKGADSYALVCLQGSTVLSSGTRVSGRIGVASSWGLQLDLSGAQLTDCSLDMTYGASFDAIVKSPEQSIGVPAGYEWEEDTSLVWKPLAAYLHRGTGSDLEDMTFDTVEEALNAAQDGDTVILTTDTTGSALQIGKSITLDLDGHCYAVEDQGNSYGLLLEQGRSLTVKNGRIRHETRGTTDVSVVLSKGDLILDGVTLEASGSVGQVLSCTSGSAELTGGTRLTAPAGSCALELYALDAVRVSVSSGCTITGGIRMRTPSNRDPAEDALQLQLNGPTLENCRLDISPWITTAAVTKDAALELDAPDGYCWEGDTTLVWTKAVASVEYVENGETVTDTYSSLQEALNSASYGDTVRLLCDTSGSNLFIGQTLTLDLGGFVYTAYSESGNYEAAVYVPSYVSLTVRNGTVTSGDPKVDILVITSGALVLNNVDLLGNEQVWCALSCDGGTVRMSNGTRLSAAADGCTLELYYTGYSDDYDNIHVTASDDTAIDGRILLDSHQEHRPTANSMVLNLNKAQVTGPLVVGECAENATVTKDASTQLMAPSGMFWKDDVILLKSVVPTEAIAIGDGEIYFNDLAKAVEASSYVQLLGNVYLDSELVIRKSVTLDLGGFAISGMGIRLTYGSSIIRNGTVYGRTNEDASIHLAGGNLTIQDLVVGSSQWELPADLDDEPVVQTASCGIFVEGSSVNASSFQMSDSTVWATQCGIAVLYRPELSSLANVNSVTVNSGSEIHGYYGILDTASPADAGLEEEERFGAATNIRIYGGTIYADSIGIVHYADGDLTYAGGTVVAGECGIYHESSGALNVYAGTIQAGSQGANRSLYGGYGIYHMGSGPLNVYGGTVQAGAAGIYHEGSSPIKISGGLLRSMAADDQGTGILYGEDATGDLTVTGGTIQGWQDGIVHNAQNLTVSGGIIDGCECGIVNPAGTATEISGGTIQNCDFGVVSDNAAPLTLSGGTIQNCVGGILHYSDGDLTVTGGIIRDCEVGIYFESEATLEISGGTIQGLDGIDIRRGRLNATGGTIVGTERGIYAEPVAAGDAPLTLVVDGASVAATGGTADDPAPALAVQDPNRFGVRVAILTDTLQGPLMADDNIEDTTEIYKQRSLRLRAPEDVIYPEGTLWYDPMQGDLVRLVFARQDVQESGLKITVKWVDENNAGNSRPGHQQLQITLKAADPGNASPNATSHRIFADGDTDDTWIQYISAGEFGIQDIDRAVADAPAGYTTTVEITGDGIVITNTVKPIEPTIIYVKRSYTYYVKRVRVKNPYNPSDSLLQTGQLNWPIPVLGTAGLMSLATGMYLLGRKKRRHEA